MSRHAPSTDRLGFAMGVAMRREGRSRSPIPTALVALLTAISLILAHASVITAAEAEGWSLTASPMTMTATEATTVSLRLTDTDGSGDIGCLRMTIPAASTVVEATVTGTSAATPWVATRSGTGPTAIRVFNADGNGKLKLGDWVDFTLSVQTDTPGDHAWDADVVQGVDCTGTAFLAPISLGMTVTATAPTPSPTPDPSPSPTPDPTPIPSPTPDPMPSPTPSASPDPTPSPSPTPDPTPSPSPTPSPAPTPSPDAVVSPSPTPSSVPAPLPAPGPSAQPAAAAGSSPPPGPSPEPAPIIVQDESEPAPASPEPGLSLPGAAAPLEHRGVPAAPLVRPPGQETVAPGQGPVGSPAPNGPTDVVRDVLSAAVENVSHVVRPEAAVAVVAEFTFPLALAVAVLLFLVVQDRVDRRDPKLRMAPQHSADTLIRFQAEDPT